MSSTFTHLFDDCTMPTQQEVSNMVKTHSRYYNYDTDYVRQERHKKKLAYLKSLLDKKQKGVPLTEAEIRYVMSPLQKAGIVDSMGNLTEHYRGNS